MYDRLSHVRGWQGMADYRLYCLDGADKVSSAEWVRADDDEAAIEVSRGRHPGKNCELWMGARLIAKLDLRDST
jgi:hypothetical protein